ncbi:MAG: uroporphyrinogen-III C-methyltransferase [Acidimicrobiales bacterium]
MTDEVSPVGRVYLVGAGPGDPGLLTVRGAELLARADVVVHDRLAEPALLDLAPGVATRIDVGKRPGQSVRQEEINGLLVRHARDGSCVVRLKGGDPFVFGRGGEEAEALAAAGVGFEIVPGVSSAIAAPAYAGIPVTHRGLSTSFTVVTGHSRHAVDTETNWEALATAAGTLVVLMGVAHRAEIARRLLAGGLPPQTPVAAVRWGSRLDQRTVRTTLDLLGETALEPPVTIVIGRVAALDLGWWENRPLFGTRIVVTRAREQSSDLVRQLRELGAETIEIPSLATIDPADGGRALRRAVADIAAMDWVVFGSANAVHRTMALVPDVRVLPKIAVVGTSTARVLEAHRVVPDLVPDRFVAEALVEAFPEGTGRVLLPRAAVTRDVIEAGLGAKGWEVVGVEAYRTGPVAASASLHEAAAAAHALTFTSSSTVTNFMATGAPVPPVVACIGPVTARTAEEAGLRVDVVAATSTVDGLVQAISRHLAGPPPSPPGGTPAE